MAITWLPMTMHCQIETLGGFAFLTCQTEGDSQDNECSDCNEEGCCSAEKSHYKTDQPSLTFQLPVLALMLDLSNLPPEEIVCRFFIVTSPEVPHCWQFVFRAASPPRAPSFAS